MTKGIKHSAPNGASLKVGIVVAQWNQHITGMLAERCQQACMDAHVKKENIILTSVPGSFELPFAAKSLIVSSRVDAVVTLGCLIKGETMHFEYIAEAVSQGIMRLGLEADTPVIFGVLTCLTEAQAIKRADPEGLDHGYEWGLSAVTMGLLKQQYKKK